MRRSQLPRGDGVSYSIAEDAQPRARHPAVASRLIQHPPRAHARPPDAVAGTLMLLAHDASSASAWRAVDRVVGRDDAPPVAVFGEPGLGDAGLPLAPPPS